MSLLIENKANLLLRRFPIFILVDVTSKPDVHEVMSFINQLLLALRYDPFALEFVYVSFVFHNNRCVLYKNALKSICDNVSLDYEQLLELFSDSYSQSFRLEDKTLFEQLYHLMIRAEVRKTNIEQKGDWQPIIVHIVKNTIGFECFWNDNSLSSACLTYDNNNIRYDLYAKEAISYVSYLFSDWPCHCCEPGETIDDFIFNKYSKNS